MRNLKPCVRCGKQFNQMSSLKYHLLKTQKQCEAKYIDLNGEEILEDYYKHLEVYNKKCKSKPVLKSKKPKKQNLN
jgi:DNA-directed RNA polymerase subunit RPC12/RpoP